MTASWWLSIGMGVAVVGLHTAVRILAHYFSARTVEQETFLVLELGGLAARMMLAFGAVALVLLLVPVHPAAFVITVIALLMLSMTAELYYVTRRRNQAPDGS